MNAIRNRVDRHLLSSIELLVAEYGVWPMLAATLRALASTRKRRLTHAGGLSDHMLRDIGLQPEPQSKPHWQLR